MTDTIPAERRRANIALLILIAAVTAGSIFYRLLIVGKLEQTSLLFIGLPAFLAILMGLTPKPKSVTGACLKVTALFLLISGILLGEGFICILMSAPIFFLVAVLIGKSIETVQRNRKGKKLACVGLIAILPLAMEGAIPGFSFPREEIVTADRIVQGSEAAVARALAEAPRFTAPLPAFLRLGFPRPVDTQGLGIAVGQARSIRFAGGEGQPGNVTVKVLRSEARRVEFTMVSDRSKIAHWLTWESSEVRWQAVDATHTRVWWTLRFRRELDPAFYFHPFERYAAARAADYMIQASATPR